MKKLISAVLLAAIVLTFAGCAKNPRCNYEAAKNELDKSETVIAYVYADEKSYEVDGAKIKELLSGEWIEGARNSKANKVVSVTVATQYEICLFDDGSAMIYSGNAKIYEKDRGYFSAKINTSLEDICKYVRENGTEVEEAEDNKAPSAE